MCRVLSSSPRRALSLSSRRALSLSSLRALSLSSRTALSLSSLGHSLHSLFTLSSLSSSPRTGQRELKGKNLFEKRTLFSCVEESERFCLKILPFCRYYDIEYYSCLFKIFEYYDQYRHAFLRALRQHNLPFLEITLSNTILAFSRYSDLLPFQVRDKNQYYNDITISILAFLRCYD